MDIYWPKEIAFVNYFWAILVDFASSIYTYIHNESIIEELHTFEKEFNVRREAFGTQLDEESGWSKLGLIKVMRLIFVSDS